MAYGPWAPPLLGPGEEEGGHGYWISGDNGGKLVITSCLKETESDSEEYSMTSDRVCALNGDDENNPDLDYYDDEDDLEAFSDADLSCEDGGTRVFPLLRKDTGRLSLALPYLLTHNLFFHSANGYTENKLHKHSRERHLQIHLMVLLRNY